MKKRKKLFLLLALGCVPSIVFAQSLLTEEEAILAAVKNSYALNAANLKVKSQQKMQGTAFNLANPDITLESPTAEFMTVGVLQSFEFPTVYYRQGKLLHQQTQLTKKEMELTHLEVIQNVRLAYLETQYSMELINQLSIQDSLFYAIAKSMQRLFDAGQIDFIAKTYASTLYGDVHNKFLQSQMDANFAYFQLQLITGSEDSLLVSPLRPLQSADQQIVQNDSLVAQGSVFNQYYEQTKDLSLNEWKLEKNKALPGFSFGYMNQGPKNSEIPFRLRAGINIPIWFWQYRAAIKSAKLKVEYTDQQVKAQQRNLQSKMQQAKVEVMKSKQALNYYSEIGLKESDDIISSTQRMLTSGVTDYVTHLRTLSEAYNRRLNAIETTKNYNQAIINLNYLIGNK